MEVSNYRRPDIARPPVPNPVVGPTGHDVLVGEWVVRGYAHFSYVDLRGTLRFERSPAPPPRTASVKQPRPLRACAASDQ